MRLKAILERNYNLKEFMFMKKIVTLLLVTIMMLSMTACGSSGSIEVKEPETVGEFICQDFAANPEGSAQEVADRLIQNDILPFEAVTMPVEPGFLTGFDNAEITGFNEGIMFAPMMGTIPFVGYVFTLDVLSFQCFKFIIINLSFNVKVFCSFIGVLFYVCLMCL